MRTDIIRIEQNGNGFETALEETRKAAEVWSGLGPNDALRLQLITEEMLCLVRSITGEIEAGFWIEAEDRKYTMHLLTKTSMDKEKRYQLISSSTSRRNEAVKGFLGKLRDIIEQALAAEVVHDYTEIPYELVNDAPSFHPDDEEWDGYERSILRRTVDDIKISIRGGEVEMTVLKSFA